MYQVKKTSGIKHLQIYTKLKKKKLKLNECQLFEENNMHTKQAQCFASMICLVCQLFTVLNLSDVETHYFSKRFFET